MSTRTAALILIALSSAHPMIRAAGAQAAETRERNPPRHQQNHPAFAAVWRADAEPTRVEQAENPTGLLAAPEGFRLADVEVWLDEGERRYAGLYRAAEGGGEQFVAAGLDADGFVAEREKHSSPQENRCLVGFEVWREGEGTRYAGVWNSGCAPEVFASGLDPVEFAAKASELAADHHLVEIETVLEPGPVPFLEVDDRLRISALWHPGAGEATWSLVGVSWETFHEWAHLLNDDGYRLADLDIQFKSPVSSKDASPTPRVSGVWRAGEGMDWIGIDFSQEHLWCADQRLPKGYENSGAIVDVPEKIYTTVCGEENKGDWEAAPQGQKLHLVTFEGYDPAIGDPSGTHLGPLHDGGTAGPP